MQKAGLYFTDARLGRAVALILEQNGYLTEANALSCDFAVTDKEGLLSENTKVLYIGREEKADKSYLHRPFGRDELINAIKRLTGQKENSVLRLDKKHKKAMYGDKILPLTEKEFALLLLLYENKGKVISDTEIVEMVWKNETVKGSNIAAVYVNYLRKKLDGAAGKQLIFRARGAGYMYKEKEDDNA